MKRAILTLLGNWKKGLQFPPVYVFQMGKVGSSSVLRTLQKRYPGHVFHHHKCYKKDSFPRRLFLVRALLGLRTRVISPFREPVSRNISAFFQNFEKIVGEKIVVDKWDTAKLKETFLDRYSHEFPLLWYENELRSCLGIDVYSEPFPIDKKWKIYQRRKVELLVYRTDLKRDVQLSVISDFLDFPFEEWTIDNVSSRKEYAPLYRAFKDEVNLPEDYLNKMYHSKFFMHFWSQSEQSSIQGKWKKRCGIESEKRFDAQN